MALQIADRVKERIQNNVGTGSLTLLGAPTGFQTFSSAISVSDTTYYCVEGPNGAFEIGVGTLLSSTSFGRTTVLRSSNGGAALNIGSGQYFLFISYIADKAVYRNIANEVVVPSEGFRFSDNTTQITSPTAAIALKADIASPTFTGTPSGPTATVGSNTTQLATTSFVSSAIAAVDLSVYVQKTSATGSLILPSGTTAQRDGSPAAGYSRWNTTTSRFERWTGSVWENYVRLSGDTMTGDLSLGSNALICGAITASGAAKFNNYSASKYWQFETGANGIFRYYSAAGPSYNFQIMGDNTGSGGSPRVMLTSGGSIEWGDNASSLSVSSMDLILKRASASTLGLYQSNGTTPANLTCATITASGAVTAVANDFYVSDSGTYYFSNVSRNRGVLITSGGGGRIGFKAGGTEWLQISDAGAITASGAIVSNRSANTDWLSGQYASSEYVKMGYNAAVGYGLIAGSVYGGTASGVSFGTNALNLRSISKVNIGTSSATFSEFDNGSNTNPYMCIHAVGLTTKPGLQIDQSVGTTSIPLNVTLNGSSVFSVSSAGAITASGNLNLTGTYPYFGLSASGWSGGTFYFQTGVDDTGTGTGNFTGLLNPVSKSFTIISGNPNTTGRKHLTIDGTTSAAIFGGAITASGVVSLPSNAGTASVPTLRIGTSGFYGEANNSLYITIGGTYRGKLGAAGFIAGSSYVFGWESSTPDSPADLFLYRGGAGTLAQRNGINAQCFLLNKSYTSDSSQEAVMLDAGKQISGKLGLYSYRGSSGGSNYPIQIGMLATDGTTFSGLSIATNGQITSGYTAMQDGFRVGSCMSTNWSSIYQVKLHPNTWIGWDSVGETGNSVDIQLNRKSLGKLAVRGDNGLCVRNLADSADAALTCGAITASGSVTAGHVAINSGTLYMTTAGYFRFADYADMRSGSNWGLIDVAPMTANQPGTLRLYNNGHSLTNYERLEVGQGVAGDAFIRTAAGGTGTRRNLTLDASTITATGNLTLSDTNIITGTTTGTIIATSNSQKLGVWGATPIVQPTTAVAAATLVSNGGTTLTDTDLFDGYTLKQIVKALRIAGLLA